MQQDKNFYWAGMLKIRAAIWRPGQRRSEVPRLVLPGQGGFQIRHKLCLLFFEIELDKRL